MKEDVQMAMGYYKLSKIEWLVSGFTAYVAWS